MRRFRGPAPGVLAGAPALRRVSPLVRLVFVVAVAAAVGWLAWARLAPAESALGVDLVAAHAVELALALAAIGCATLLLAGAWATVSATSPDAARGRGLLVLVFAVTWLGRYLPGKLPGLAGRVYVARGLGYPFTPLLVGTGVATTVEVVAAALVAFLFLSVAVGQLLPIAGSLELLAYPAAALAVAGGAAAALAGTVRGRRLARRWLGGARAHLRPAPARSQVARAGLYALLSRLVSGLALYFVIASITQVTPADLALLIGAASGAAVASMAVSLAPGGLGVREGILMVLLAPAFGVETAAAAAVIFRALSVVSDVLWFIAALVLAPLLYRVPLHAALAGRRRAETAHAGAALAAGAVEERVR